MRYTWVVAVLALLLTVSFAADKADFSGTWKLDEAKSTLDEMGTAFVPVKITITQENNDMTIAKTYENPERGEFTDELKLTLDGKECKSEVWGGSPRICTANWNENGDVLNVATTIKFERDGQTSTMDMDEAMSLQDDGKALSIKSSSSSDWGERNITMVFAKAE